MCASFQKCSAVSQENVIAQPYTWLLASSMLSKPISSFQFFAILVHTICFTCIRQNIIYIQRIYITCAVSIMLRRMEDCYIDYVAGLLARGNIDMNVVRTTLVSLGFDDRSIDIMLGEALNLRWTSGSSSTTMTASEPASETASRTSLEKGAVPFLYGDNAVKLSRSYPLGEVPEGTGSVDTSQQRLPVDFRDKIISLSSTGSHSCMCQEDPSSSCTTGMGYEPEVGLPPFINAEGCQQDRGNVPGERYKRHLEALEELLGVVWFPSNEVVDRCVPLRVRNELCRSRLKKLIMCGKGPDKILLPLPQYLYEAEREDWGTPQKSYDDRAVRFFRHLDTCDRHHSSIQRRRSRSPRQRRPCDGALGHCELCRTLSYRFLLSCKGEQRSRPQTTSAAAGGACHVKMRPLSVNTVGCGRINVKAVVTTLPRREDRVGKALAYRAAWSRFGLWPAI
ncbi:hypothetical protein, conserved [Trypanosoma brucei gambiense DAL972]|uniref:Uncharacterized protein n=2 Tax=Trypanosoma brucei TaxID=5691 RepID=C9ZL29_TRYB9|nr:hypothetical protein, conserved [Trypanosoma brucei gambiense DAL972]CBH10038.1 hypothetical protein, conserved [Trypanosoma brucei gambiense DAL972]|eukprot:XP_011772328.1 hypothetical protein, conserved [Trypanosoma brucei gambiense DAL972]